MTIKKDFVVSRTVEHVDTDASAIVHFSKYPAFIESAIFDYLENECEFYWDNTGDFEFRVVGLALRYKSPARFRETVQIYLNLDVSSPSIMKFNVKIKRDSTSLMIGTIDLACVDKSTEALTQVPERLVANL